MKKIVRMLFFSGVALYLTALWNRGFLLHLEIFTFLKAALLVGLVYYLITTILKILLLPLNFVTFGLASVVFYVGLFYFIFSRFSIGQIQEWQFQGLNLWWIDVPKIQLNYWSNVIVSSFSVSTIINLLEFFL